MRLVRLNKDVIVNLDRVSMIYGREMNNEGKHAVFIVADGEERRLGYCENRSDFEKFMTTFYGQCYESFPLEVIEVEEEEEKEENLDLEELWK